MSLRINNIRENILKEVVTYVCCKIGDEVGDVVLPQCKEYAPSSIRNAVGSYTSKIHRILNPIGYSICMPLQGKQYYDKD